MAKDGEGGKPEICEMVQRVEVARRRVVCVTSSLTTRTRCKIRNLRRRRYWWRAHTCGRLGRGLSRKAVEGLDKLGFYVAPGCLLTGSSWAAGRLAARRSEAAAVASAYASALGR